MMSRDFVFLMILRRLYYSALASATFLGFLAFFSDFLSSSLKVGLKGAGAVLAGVFVAADLVVVAAAAAAVVFLGVATVAGCVVAAVLATGVVWAAVAATEAAGAV